MSYTFDTTRTRSQRGVILDAVVAALARLRSTQPLGFFQTIAPFGGIVRGYTDDVGVDMVWEAIQGATPALLVSVGDGRSTPAGMGGLRFNKTVELHCYFINNRNDGLPRIDTDAASLASLDADPLPDPGVFYAMERVEELLVGLDHIGTDIKRIIPQNEEELATDSSLTMWRQLYTVEFARTFKSYRDTTTKLDSMRTNLINTTDPEATPLDPNPSKPVTIRVETDNLEP